MLKVAGADRYAPEGVSRLEQHVDEQIAKNVFNLDSNLALLRMYQFSPGTANVQVIVKVLLKAICAMPGPEYRACLHLLPERTQNEEAVYRVMQMAGALETARYVDFWALAANARDLLALVPGFYEAVRAYICQTLSLSFSRITRATLASCLQLQGDTLAAFVKDKVANGGWSEVKAAGGDVVVLPKNEYNQLSSRRTQQEIIRFDQAAPMLRALTVGF